jgi:hypothetical protein
MYKLPMRELVIQYIQRGVSNRDRDRDRQKSPKPQPHPPTAGPKQG